MSYIRYLKEHAGWLAIWCFLVVTIDIFLLTVNGASMLMLYVALSITVMIIIGTYLDYRRLKLFLIELEKTCETLDKKYLLPEMITEINTQEEALYVDLIKKMETSMADNVAAHRRTSEDYKSYIETWVHEVKIPIATAKLIIENHGDETVREACIEKEIKRIQGYVEQALFFARSEAVEKDYMIKELDLEEIVTSVIYDKKRILREKRAGIDIHDMSVSKKVVSDDKWISFIISQVVENSIKYAKEDTQLVIEIFMTEENGKAILHIKDNGIGMKDGEVGRAFEKGFTGTNGRNVSASTGIGLYLCRKLCQRLEHEMSLSSKEGEGVEVCIVL